LIIISFAWAILGDVDIVVIAPGKVVPAERTKSIASVEIGRIVKLNVREGQYVNAGDLLVEIDTRIADSEHQKSLLQTQFAKLEKERTLALIEAIDMRQSPKLVPIEDIPPLIWQEASNHLLWQWRHYDTQRKRLESEIEYAHHVLVLNKERARDFESLSNYGDVSRHAWQDKVQAYIDASARLQSLQDQLASLNAEIRLDAQAALEVTEKTLLDANQAREGAAARLDSLKLLSPIDGTVHQLTLHTLGGVVPAAEPLMLIVPTRSSIEIEAALNSRDVGFVKEGQEVAVKIDSFEYTKYGTVSGRVILVSRDAVKTQDEQLLYTVKVEIDDSRILVGSEFINIVPGMGSTVEIKTGTRSVISYFLSPILQHTNEAMRER
jgi:hemolysin D